MKETDATRTHRMRRAVDAIAEAVNPVIDGTVILAVDVTILVQHSDGRVGLAHLNTGLEDRHKQAVARGARRYHAGTLGTPDHSDSYTTPRPPKH